MSKTLSFTFTAAHTGTAVVPAAIVEEILGNLKDPEFRKGEPVVEAMRKAQAAEGDEAAIALFVKSSLRHAARTAGEDLKDEAFGLMSLRISPTVVTLTQKEAR
ncbi:hypothetical protein Atoyac1_27 [Aeromonas phage Atoyac1]|uniref:Uncharacterized protein n=1 Tax=Aeromonas phage Atoyac1 TaxID=2767547 RepID=A0A866D169_9CAUD|nr:hypothetical protein Atoyac1_27 [Aeromonas phage Atoyac1]